MILDNDIEVQNNIHYRGLTQRAVVELNNYISRYENQINLMRSSSEYVYTPISALIPTLLYITFEFRTSSFVGSERETFCIKYHYTEQDLSTFQEEIYNMCRSSRALDIEMTYVRTL